jgi:phosphatidate cytidylyltransferase
VSRPEPVRDQMDAGRHQKSPELAMRVASAVVMAAVAIAAVFFSPWSFLLLILAGAAIVNWEWSRLVRGEGSDAIALIQGASLLAITVLSALGRFWLVLGLFVLAELATLWLARDRQRLFWSLFGLLYMVLPAASLVWIRSDQSYGALAILFVLLAAWTADTAAFAAGRLIGGPKLAPSISPKKTWSGFVAGLVLPTVLGYGFAYFVLHQPGLYLALVAAALALACQLGDLAESGIKRHFGVKDASGLIPGHGGLLDRIDGFMLASPVAALIALRDWVHPGHGLLLW